MSICRSCGATIEFVETKNGKQMPMNIEASPCPTCDGTGSVRAFDGVAKCGKCDGAGTLILSHFATCPMAAQHRRAR